VCGIYPLEKNAPGYPLGAYKIGLFRYMIDLAIIDIIHYVPKSMALLA